MTDEIKVVKTIDYNTRTINDLYLNSERKSKILLDLHKYARRFLDINFDLNLTIPIKIDARLTRAGGSFRFYDNARRKEPIEIKLSEKFIIGALQDEQGVEAIIDILAHELTHYALFMQDLPYNDGTPTFERKLKELSIGASGATHKNKVLTKKKNIWYRLVDVYQIGNNTYKYQHAKTNRPQLGNRKQVIIQKYSW